MADRYCTYPDCECPVDRPKPLDVACPRTECDHDWKFQDDSFDHEFGTERVHYFLCETCGAVREMEPGDYEYDD